MRFSLHLIPAATLFATLTLNANNAHAIRPDFDGERGIEAQLNFGIAGYSNTTQRLFADADRTGPSFTGNRNLLGPGPYFRGALGYRILPMLSVGATFSFHSIGAGLLELTPVTFRANASALAAGVYARLYLMPFFPSASRTPRVEFAGFGDLRRLDAWVSLGIEAYQRLVHRQTDSTEMSIFDESARSSVGIPVGLGADYRVLPMLAFGLNTQLTTVIGAPVTRTGALLQGGVIVPFTQNYTGLDAVNLGWSVSLSARYTLTL